MNNFLNIYNILKLPKFFENMNQSKFLNVSISQNQTVEMINKCKVYKEESLFEKFDRIGKLF